MSESQAPVGASTGVGSEVPTGLERRLGLLGLAATGICSMMGGFSVTYAHVSVD